MAAKNAENTSAETESVSEEVKVPHQQEVPHLEVIEGDNAGLAERVKSVLSNKKFIAGVSSVAAIAVGVFVINNRRNAENAPEAEVAEG